MKIDFSAVDSFVVEGINRMGMRAYLDVKGFSSLFMRIAHHQVNGKLTKTLDIGNVEVDPKLRNTGHFKALVRHCRALCLEHKLALYVECVHNPILERYLLRSGFASDGMELGPSFSLSLDQMQNAISIEDEKNP